MNRLRKQKCQDILHHRQTNNTLWHVFLSSMMEHNNILNAIKRQHQQFLKLTRKMSYALVSFRADHARRVSWEKKFQGEEEEEEGDYLEYLEKPCCVWAQTLDDEHCESKMKLRSESGVLTYISFITYEAGLKLCRNPACLSVFNVSAVQVQSTHW